MKVKIERKTKETNIIISLNLYGKGKYNIKTSIPFLDHMLELFSKHGNFDLNIKAKGDREIDDHHLVEDIGIVLGLAIKKSIENRKNINRYGNFLMPMDEALNYVVIDLSGRPYFSYEVKFNKMSNIDFDYSLIKEFFRAVAYNAQMTLHIKNYKGENNHHIAESIFKGFAKALSQAVSINKKIGLPSTKGKIKIKTKRM
ncbi:MAG: imidazoleglycerol-phosphate dehydratase HisB [Endomicrobiia bacterium]